MKNKKIILSIGTIALAVSPVIVATSCTNWVGQKYNNPEGNDLTNAPESVWHSFFHGRHIPEPGTIFKVTVGASTYKYTWTAEDNQTSLVVKYTKKEASIPEMLAYIANRFATAGGDASSIFNAFGVPFHGVGTMPTVDMSDAPKTVATEVVDPNIVIPTVMITGEAGWHELFYGKVPVAGTKIQLPVGEVKTTENKSTKDEVAPAATVTKPAGYESYSWFKYYAKGSYYWYLSERILTVEWTAGDNASKTISGWKDRNGVTYGDVVKYVTNKFISVHTRDAFLITESIKKYSGGHTIWEENDFVAKRTDKVTYKIDEGNVYSASTGKLLANTCRDSWHYIFALDIDHRGRTLPVVGDVFQWEGDSYTWTEADNEVLAPYLTMRWNEWKATEYVAARVAKGNMDTFWGILSTLGRDHNADIANGTTRPDDWPLRPNQTISLNTISSAYGPSSWIWHKLSGFGDEPTTLVEGNKLAVFVPTTISQTGTGNNIVYGTPVAHNKYYEYTLTKRDVTSVNDGGDFDGDGKPDVTIVNGKEVPVKGTRPIDMATNPASAASYIATRFTQSMAAGADKTALENGIKAAMGFVGQYHSGGFDHTGIKPSTPATGSATIVLTTTATGAVSSIWHKLVGYNNASTFIAGNKLELTVDGVKQTYTITAADVAALPKDFSVNEQGSVTFVANLLLPLFPGKTLADIYSAMGFYGEEHGRPGENTHIGTGDKTVWMTGRESWHTLFYNKVPKVGTVLVLPTAASDPGSSTKPPVLFELTRITWTQADSDSAAAKAYLAGNSSQGAMVQYVYNRFVATATAGLSGDDLTTKTTEVKDAVVKFSGGHNVISTVDPEHSQVRKTPGRFNMRTGQFNSSSTTADFDYLNGSYNNARYAWHELFAFDGPGGSDHLGRSLPLVGDIIQYGTLTGTATHSYTWTAADNVAMAGWLSYEMSIYDTIEYVTNKVFGVTETSNERSLDWHMMVELGSRQHNADSNLNHPKPAHWKTLSLEKGTRSPITMNSNITLLKTNLTEGMYIGVIDGKMADNAIHIVTAADVAGKPADFATNTTSAIDYLATIISKGNATLKTALIAAMTP